jgi:CRP-like cAMP-binding protein
MKRNKPDLTTPPKAPLLAGVAPIPRRLAAGEWLFRQGDATFGIFFVAAGRLRMQRVTPDGATVVMHFARAGEMLAEASLFSERYQCEVVAESEGIVWVYPKRELTQALRNDPDSLWSFAASLACGLHGLRLRYELKQVRSAQQRVLQLLRLRCDANGVFRCDGSLQDLAAELGLTREALYRALAALEKRGAIERTKEQLRLVAIQSNKQ